MFKIRNRYIVLMGALLVQITIAGLNAWSVFAAALQTERGLCSNALMTPFALVQLAFALSILLSGRVIDRYGPQMALIIGGTLYGGGMILSAFVSQPWMLSITYGIISGAGVGFVYLCPLSTLCKWFPSHKSLITGLSMSIFVIGSFVFHKIITAFLSTTTVSGAFLNLGLISMTTILLGALFAHDPENHLKYSPSQSPNDFSTREMIKSSPFKAAWITYCLTIVLGMSAIGFTGWLDAEMDHATLQFTAVSALISCVLIAGFALSLALKVKATDHQAEIGPPL